MSTVSPEKALAAEQAATWVARLESGDVTDAERQHYEAWLAESPAHCDAIEEAFALSRMADVVARLSAEERSALGMTGSALEPPSNTTAQTTLAATRRLPVQMWLLAASILLIVSMSATLYFFSNDAILSGSYETEVGEIETIRLPDGSVVRLNTGTALSVDYRSDVRLVRLRHGEAYFDIAHDEARPFIVATGTATVRAVGTAFRVRLYEEAPRVTVTEGRVFVRPSPLTQEQQNIEPADLARSHATGVGALLEQGQEVVVAEDETFEVVEIQAEEIARELSWREEMLAFDGETLEQAVNEIGRYTPYTIRIADDDLRNLKVGGYFPVGDLDGLFLLLQASYDLEVHSLGDDTVELRKKQSS